MGGLLGIHALSQMCFKKCITGSIKSGKLDSSEESCVQNCVGRFMDSNMLTLRHLEKMRGGA
jgi:import inner membrane translocase subunit TIM8